MPTPNESPKAAPAWRWILNNQERVVAFALPSRPNKIAGGADRDPNPISLQPGANLVDARRWEALKAAEQKASDAAKANGIDVPPGEITRLLTSRIPRETHRNRTPEAAGQYYLVEAPGVASKADPLAGIADADAVALVEELRDLQLVRAIIAVEKRPVVSEALAARRTELSQGLDAGQAA